MALFGSEDIPLFYEEFGESVQFRRRASASSATVNAVFDEGKQLGLGGDKGEDADEVMRPGLGNYTVIFFDQVALPTRPTYQDTATRADGSVYTILQSKAEDGMWKCWAVSDERAGF